MNFSLIDHGPRTIRKSEAAHRRTVGSGGHGRTRTHGRLSRRNNADLVQTELLMRSHGCRHMTRMRRIESPT